jgi:hypothetical protein
MWKWFRHRKLIGYKSFHIGYPRSDFAYSRTGARVSLFGGEIKHSFSFATEPPALSGTDNNPLPIPNPPHEFITAPCGGIRRSPSGSMKSHTAITPGVAFACQFQASAAEQEWRVMPEIQQSICGVTHELA